MAPQGGKRAGAGRKPLGDKALVRAGFVFLTPARASWVKQMKKRQNASLSALVRMAFDKAFPL